MKIIMDYGKIKVQMKNWNIIDVIHVDYWRCDQETTLVWHGYFARFDSSRKFQQLAAYNVFHTIKWTSLISLEFETEKYNS
ncbi:Protein CBG26250 [Caenorhabditis briggsae]|uniref:Protein CBG26250 n=1 Tax=Caenorhabditis briggsae TaxID=6238 RepID=B6ILX1_CAEBR|nr:Protein CBG26250 [Caenorhabditis briggsae]CAS00901.1 Protein CBG26250 [Caenorhabditis briggsae]